MKTNFCWKLSPLVLAELLGPGRGRPSLPEESGGPQIVQISPLRGLFSSLQEERLGRQCKNHWFSNQGWNEQERAGATERALGL